MSYYQNVEQILKDGGIYAKNYRDQPQHSISYSNINNRRGSQYKTPEGELLHDYVPFYFSPITAMSYTIHRGNVPLMDPSGVDLGCANDEDVVFLVSRTESVQRADLKFCFTNVACNSQAPAPEYENDLSKLSNHIDWSLFDEVPKTATIDEIDYSGVGRYFRDFDSPERYNNRSTKRMAEFMVRDIFPVELLDCIVTKKKSIKSEIESWIRSENLNLSVYQKTGCYF